MADGNYDKAQAKGYREVKHHRWRQSLEEFTFITLVKGYVGEDLSQVDVLDLACGHGVYSRLLKGMGSRSTVGVDVSPNMIKLAREAENREPIGCEYIVSDVKDLNLAQKFDMIIANFFFCYASTLEELNEYAAVTAMHLKPGGRVIGINANPFWVSPNGSVYRKYGLTTKFVQAKSGAIEEGDGIHVNLYHSDGGVAFEIVNTYFKPKTYEDCFERNGFAQFQWKNLQLSPGEIGDPFWDVFLADPPLIAFEANL